MVTLSTFDGFLCCVGSVIQLEANSRTSVRHTNGDCVLQSRVRSCPSSRPTNPFAQKENCRAVTASASTRSCSVTASPTARTSPTRTHAVSVAMYYTRPYWDRVTDMLTLSDRGFWLKTCRKSCHAVKTRQPCNPVRIDVYFDGLNSIIESRLSRFRRHGKWTKFNVLTVRWLWLSSKWCQRGASASIFKPESFNL